MKKYMFIIIITYIMNVTGLQNIPLSNKFPKLSYMNTYDISYRPRYSPRKRPTILYIFNRLNKIVSDYNDEVYSMAVMPLAFVFSNNETYY